MRELRDGQNAISALKLQMGDDDLISNDSTYDSQNHYSNNSKHGSLYLGADRPNTSRNPQREVMQWVL